MTYWFTADEHYGHAAIIKHCDRPFETVHEMNKVLTENHNAVVRPEDVVIHAGDFCWANSKKQAEKYIRHLNGSHIFLRGSHDKWMGKSAPMIWEKTIDGQFLVVCHYAMRTWRRSHYNSYQFYAHSHGRLEPIGKQWDIGVDNNNFYPLSFEQLKVIMDGRPDNPGYIIIQSRKR